MFDHCRDCADVQAAREGRVWAVARFHGRWAAMALTEDGRPEIGEDGTGPIAYDTARGYYF